MERNIPWADAVALMDWQQGEHVTLIGSTGLGKTTTAMEIMPIRDYPIVVVTKPSGRDKTILHYKKRDRYKLVTSWPPTTVDSRILFWPTLKHPDDVPNQQRQIRNLLRNAFTRGAYAILLDELRYITDDLGLKSEVELLWQQGRSLGISMVVCAQRPAHVPLLAYSQATHLFLWRDNDKRNVSRMAELGAFDSKTIALTIANLDKHEVLYLNTRTGAMVTTNTRNV